MQNLDRSFGRKSRGDEAMPGRNWSPNLPARFLCGPEPHARKCAMTTLPISPLADRPAE
jgi:hypothetical protein